MFPDYDPIERLTDAAVHVLGVFASLVAAPILIALVIPTHDTESIVAAAVYASTLTGTLGISAAYNLVGRPNWKELLRRLDHGAIFLLIAGTYTPFAAVSLGGRLGGWLLVLVWLAASGGFLVKLAWPRRFERASVIVYLVLGWIGLPATGALIASLPAVALVLLLVGGICYTIGVVFFLWGTLPHHNAIWHIFVLAGAGCHFVAVLKTLVTP